eukprot:1155000-Pelagomonas_calceolata.AAC.2
MGSICVPVNSSQAQDPLPPKTFRRHIITRTLVYTKKPSVTARLKAAGVSCGGHVRCDAVWRNIGLLFFGQEPPSQVKFRHQAWKAPLYLGEPGNNHAKLWTPLSHNIALTDP